MEALAIIPYRGGSKGNPRTNVHLLAGKPILARTIEHACQARHVSRRNSNIHPGYGGDFLSELQNAHLYHFTLNTLVSLMGKFGFELVYRDEYIHALFVKKQGYSALNNNEFKLVLFYLIRMEMLYIALQTRNSFMQAVRKFLGNHIVDWAKKF